MEMNYKCELLLYPGLTNLNSDFAGEMFSHINITEK